MLTHLLARPDARRLRSAPDVHLACLGDLNALDLNHRVRRIVVLTGAGISAESGLRTFRAADGLWEDHRIEDVASPEGYRRDPKLVHDFYNARRAALGAAAPNAAHLALAEFESRYTGEFLLVTQNIDDLHERAGSKRLLHMHGQLRQVRCDACDRISAIEDALGPRTRCPDCQGGFLRPHIVWFGEMPLYMDEITAALERCSLFVAIGTSGQVYPAAGFVRIAAAGGAWCIEANLEASAVAAGFNEHRTGPATEVVPGLFAEIA